MAPLAHKKLLLSLGVHVAFKAPTAEDREKAVAILYSDIFPDTLAKAEKFLKQKGGSVVQVFD